MAATPYLSLIIPAYNEAGSIRRTLELCQRYLDQQKYGYEIIVGADGNDGCREIVATLATTNSRLQVFGSAGRGGKGKAIRTGVGRARGQIIGFADADYKTPIEELDKVLPWLERGYDMVIGSRGTADARIRVRQPWFRRLGSWAFGVGMRTVTGLRGISDTQCGFKFFHRVIARDLFRRQCIDGYMFDVEILYLAQQSGYLIKEVGVSWQDDGDSRLQLVAGNWRNFKDVLRIRFGRSASPSLAACRDEESQPDRSAAA
jgi:glycosyltransferase involved in cell wall biosynthesis